MSRSLQGPYKALITKGEREAFTGMQAADLAEIDPAAWDAVIVDDFKTHLARARVAGQIRGMAHQLGFAPEPESPVQSSEAA